ncbi:carnitine O-palmitoyltransferase 2, mitochondrial-like [Lytechinus variegatus]|uniref:carnitine O-palmitoyltransferase 2, mitochondrial-like n=1 Tax=Lytechinus variegatus TaxID=7654 RepID=UPI001BB0F07F|nr:carnitine O-palmitoyltransferase 2, mitochondrial-like [Lytechinus variegatus]
MAGIQRLVTVERLRSKANCLPVASSWRAIQSLRKSSTSSDYIQDSIVPTMHFQHSLPRLPIPKLSDTCRRYLASQEPVLTPEVYAATEKIVQEFEKGEGNSLNSQLIAQNKRNKHTSYISGPWFDMYLESRASIVLNFNPYFSYTFDDRPEYNDQLIRSSNFVVSALRLMKTMRAGKLEPEVYHLNPKKSDTQSFRKIARWMPQSIASYYAIINKAFPLDMSQYFRLFNSTRIPRIGRDELVTDESGRHLLVVRNGHYFTFDVIDREGNIVSPADIQANLQYILNDNTPRPDAPLGYLTAENRDTWANVREQIVGTSEKNAETMKMIDSAVFCLCLDDTSPDVPESVTRNNLYGDAAYRWFDKSFQIIVCKNGLMSVNFEHAWGDGVAVLRLFNETYKDLTEQPALSPSSKPSNIDPSQCVNRLTLDLEPSVSNAIKTARENYEAATSKLRIDTNQHMELGKNFLKSCKISPDSVMQLSFQMAYYRMTGKVGATYESCSTAAFKHGRTETLRSATKETFSCSQAFQKDSSAGLEEKRRLLHECSDKHNVLTKEAAMGQGWDRHLFALRTLAAKEGKTPAIFADPAYSFINHIILSTSTLSAPAILIGGFAPVVPNGLGIGYTASDDSVGCHITSYPNSLNGSDFVACVADCWKDIHDVLSRTNKQ